MIGSPSPQITVIIPAYNAGLYIDRSVKSILSQSYSRLRLLVVNDGSTDDTGERLRSLAAEDDRLEILDVENRGPALARNAALERLNGDTEYVMFMDADDELAPGTIDYAVAQGQGADVVIFGFSIVEADGFQRDYFEPGQQLDRGSLGSALAGLYKANLLNQVWGKLFRLSLIRDNSISFPNYMWGEDRLFVYACLQAAGSVAVLPRCMYRYLMHPGESLISRFYDKKPEVCLEADKKMQSLCAALSVTDEADYRYMFAKTIFSCMTTLFAPSCHLSHREKRAYVRDIIEDPHVRRRCDRVFGGFAVNLLCAVVRSGSVGLNMAVFYLVAMTGRRNPKLFLKLKHRK